MHLFLKDFLLNSYLKRIRRDWFVADTCTFFILQVKSHLFAKENVSSSFGCLISHPADSEQDMNCVSGDSSQITHLLVAMVAII